MDSLPEYIFEMIDNIFEFPFFYDHINKLQNYLIKNYDEDNNKDNQSLKSINKSKGLFITIDMCPSVNKIEKSLFYKIKRKI